MADSGVMADDNSEMNSAETVPTCDSDTMDVDISTANIAPRFEEVDTLIQGRPSPPKTMTQTSSQFPFLPFPCPPFPSLLPLLSLPSSPPLHSFPFPFPFPSFPIPPFLPSLHLPSSSLCIDLPFPSLF
jgi:hypothetical protein